MPTEQILHGIDVYDEFGLCWQILFNGCDEDDELLVCRKWLSYLCVYCEQGLGLGLGKANSLDSSGNNTSSTNTVSVTGGRGQQIIHILQEGLISKKGFY